MRCILQDSRGFMWFGTDEGLNRYDGKEFIVFKNIPGDSTSVAGNEIHDLLADHEGILWIATGDGGLSSYDFRKAKFRQYHIQQTDAAVANGIASIEIDNQNNFWVGTEKNGLYLFDKNSRSFSLQSQTLNGKNQGQLSKAYGFYDIASDKTGNVYFGTLSYSLEILHYGKMMATTGAKAYPFPAHTINCIFIDSKGHVWLGAWDNALHEYDPKTNSISSVMLNKNDPFTYSGDEIISISEDEKGWLWIGTRRNGLYLFNPSTKEILNLKKNLSDNSSLSSNTIRTIFRDSQNRMWLGTDAGIDVYDPLLHQFEITHLKTIIPDAGDDETVYDFLHDGNTFYVATSRGLMISSDTIYRVGTMHHVATGKFIRKTFSYNKEALSITKIFRDRQGVIYLGTNKTVFVFNPKDFSVKTFNCSFRREGDQFDFFNIASSRIVNISEGNWNGHDVLWICPYGHGVGVFDKKTLSGMVSTLNIPDNMENLIQKVFVDSKNNCWLLCAGKGLGHGITSPVAEELRSLWSRKNFDSKFIDLDSALLQSEFIPRETAGSSSLNINNLYDMVENEDGTYWLTSQGRGLVLFNPSASGTYSPDSIRIKPGKRSERAFISFPCEHNDMSGLMKDKNGNLWIIVSGGLEFFDVKKKQFHFFGFKEGIPGEGVQRYFYRSNDGFAYAGGNGYFIRFRPEEIQFNLASPEIAITHFKIFDKPSDSLLLQEKINLSYRNNFFSFEFAALNFTDPDANQYAYMLEGVDHDWVYSGNRNFASYTNLHGGHYVFKVKAANNNGVWDEAGMSIPIYIKPPLWQYSWFYPSLILLLVAGGFFIYRNRLQQIHKQQEEKLRTEIEAQEQERVRIAQDLHDDFGTRISALKIYMSTLEKYLDTKSEEAVAVKESAKSMVNEAMSDLRTLLMNLSPKTLEMHGYHAAVHDLVNRLNHTGMFEVELIVAPSLDRFDKKHELALYRITQELLNNSIKHAQCTEISIQLLERDNLLVLTYADNGKGFDKSQLREKGFGLKNIENRVQLIGGKINWDTEPGRGISVIVEVPETFPT